MCVFGISDIGCMRQKNEDSFCISSRVHGLYIVADGMGGHNAGEVASNLTIDVIEEYIALHINDSTRALQDILEQAFCRANGIVYDMSQHYPEMSGMGTTVTLALIIDDNLYISHVGDSRAYVMVEGQLIQLTKDHTLVEALIEAGTISKEQGKYHPNRNVITNAIGTDIICKSDFIHISDEKINVIDKILLCTDGLTNKINDDELEIMLNENKTPQMMCEKMVDIANERGGEDNITVVIVDTNSDNERMNV